MVMKCLEKDRNRRYETASALAADVQRYLQDEPVQACPPSLRYRLGKYLRRNRGSVLVGGIVFLGLFGGLLGAAYGAIEAASRREVAGLYEQAVSARKDAEVARDGEASARRQAQAVGEKLAVEEYGRTMQVAYQECLDYNVPAALALLDRTRPELLLPHATVARLRFSDLSVSIPEIAWKSWRSKGQDREPTLQASGVARLHRAGVSALARGGLAVTVRPGFSVAVAVVP
jgi:hypothetical protein